MNLNMETNNQDSIHRHRRLASKIVNCGKGDFPQLIITSSDEELADETDFNTTLNCKDIINT